MQSSSPKTATRRVLVVAGLITRDDGRLLITRRRPDQAMPDQWELPGGKIEPGESPAAALVRELFEELGAAVDVGRIWDVLYHRYPDFELVMLVYHCRLAAGCEPRRLQVADLVWCMPSELSGFDILPADRPLIDRLASEGLPGW